MSEDRRQILDMLSKGQITAEQAERLIAALHNERPTSGSSGGASGDAKPPAKYLRVVVESDEARGPVRVNIRVPMKLLRAGVRLVSLIPAQARDHVDKAMREQGVPFDLNQLKPENLEELIDHLNELTVDVDEPQNRVRVFCE